MLPLREDFPASGRPRSQHAVVLDGYLCHQHDASFCADPEMPSSVQQLLMLFPPCTRCLYKLQKPTMAQARPEQRLCPIALLQFSVSWSWPVVELPEFVLGACCSWNYGCSVAQYGPFGYAAPALPLGQPPSSLKCPTHQSPVSVEMADGQDSYFADPAAVSAAPPGIGHSVLGDPEEPSPVPMCRLCARLCWQHKLPRRRSLAILALYMSKVSPPCLDECKSALLSLAVVQLKAADQVMSQSSAARWVARVWQT
mmetsp:Transcript_134582/g.262068  ORF Transcript_134582/g.262068 Transcript_134582/m.262068 type:complete len:255 (-) Transcript_134582:190-954(-)